MYLYASYMVGLLKSEQKELTMSTQAKTETSVDTSKTVTYTAEQTVMLQTILKYAMQREFNEAGRSANPREAVKRLQSIIDLDDLLK